jgi:hypothetical protein
MSNKPELVFVSNFLRVVRNFPIETDRLLRPQHYQSPHMPKIINLLQKAVGQSYRMSHFPLQRHILTDLHQQYGLEKAWLSFQHEDILTKKFYQQYDFSNKIIIAFEASASFCHYLHQRNIPYINILIGPYRYLNDLSLLIYSNINKVNQFAQKYQLHDDILYHYAKTIQQQVTERTKPTEHHKDKTLLIIAQKSFDCALVRNKELDVITNYQEKILKLAKKFKQIYILMHPSAAYQKTPPNIGEVALMKYLQSRSNIPIELIYGNGYHLLSSDFIDHVVAMNSSMLKEASYFGKATTSLIPSVYEKGSPLVHRKANPYILLHQILSPAFWRHILLQQPYEPHELILENNHARHFFSGYWAYKAFMNDCDDIFKIEYIRYN